MNLIERDGVLWLRGPMYWPDTVTKGKRTWVEHRPCGFWSRAATAEEILGVAARALETWW